MQKIKYSDLRNHVGERVAVQTARGKITGKLEIGSWSGDFLIWLDDQPLDGRPFYSSFYIEPHHKVFELV